MSIRKWMAAVLVAAWAAAATTVAAQEWPQRPVKLVIPFGPGGNVDIAARIVSARLQEVLGAPFIVENRPGAGGLIASEFVSKSPPDGYTIFIGANGPLLFSPIVAGRTTFDWKREFDAVAPLSFTPLVLQVRPALGVKTVKEFFELAKRKDLNMGNGGAGSTNHLTSELLQSQAGVKWTTVNYKGNAPVLNGLMSGEIDFSIEQVSVAMPLIKDGRTVPLAVTSRTRFSQLPDIPTFDESGFKGFEAVTWTGLFSPAGTPKVVIDRLNAAMTTVLAEPAIVKRFNDLGSDTRAMTSEAFTQFVAKENATWAPIVRNLKLKPE